MYGLSFGIEQRAEEAIKLTVIRGYLIGNAFGSVTLRTGAGVPGDCHNYFGTGFGTGFGLHRARIARCDR